MSSARSIASTATSRHRRELECPEQVACGDEHEVSLDLRRPHVRVGGLAAGEAIEHGGGDERLPALELTARGQRPQQPLPVQH
jgi:hypothetical protein